MTGAGHAQLQQHLRLPASASRSSMSARIGAFSSGRVLISERAYRETTGGAGTDGRYFPGP
jgi:hypothetical protein